MATEFDETDDYYSIPDSSVLTFPDGVWCFGMLARTLSGGGTGAAYHYAVSNNNYAATSSINIYMGETSTPWPGQWFVYLVDDSGTTVCDAREIISANTIDGAWRLLVVQRESDDFVRTYSCEFGGTVVSGSVGGNAASDAVNGGVWNIGRRADGNADRYCGSDLAEIFKGDFNLTTSEIEDIANGRPPYALGHTLNFYLPMREATSTMNDWVSGLTATRNSVPTTTDHPPVMSHLRGSKRGMREEWRRRASGLWVRSSRPIHQLRI